MPPYTSTKAHAFSLIELMVVVAILGAFALPFLWRPLPQQWQTPCGAHAYQNYTLRTLQAPTTW